MSAAEFPPHLSSFFAPRPPLIFLEPVDKYGEKEKCHFNCISNYLEDLENYDHNQNSSVPVHVVKKMEKSKRLQLFNDQLRKAYSSWCPPRLNTDPFKTLHISKLSLKVNENILRDEFSRFGPVKNVTLIRNKKGKSLKYGFVEFEREKDLKAAYHDADGMRILDRRISVDVERGRTVKNWKPRRLGGVIGKTLETKPSSFRDNSHSSVERKRSIEIDYAPRKKY